MPSFSRSGGEDEPTKRPRTRLQRARSVFIRLLQSTGHAAWVTGTSLLVLVVPLIIEMDREAQLVEMENQQLGVLSGSPAGASASAPAAN